MIVDPRAQTATDLGIAASELKDWPAAIEAFTEARQWAPAVPGSWYNLANAFYRSGNHQQAIYPAIRACEMWPGYVNHHLLLGNIHGELSQFSAALDAFLRVLELEPRHMIAVVNLAHTFERMQMHEEAWYCYEYAVLLGADRSTAWSAAYHAAMSCCRWDLADRARHEFETYLAWGGENRAAPFQMLTMQGGTRQQQLAAARNYVKSNFSQIAPLQPAP